MQTDDSRSDVTLMLQRITDGSVTAPDRLLEIVYDDLRKLAGAYMQNERPDHTLQATALVHEAYMRLVDWQNVSWENRAHFFSVAAGVMRNVLIDHARSRRAGKRSANVIVLDENLSVSNERPLDLIKLDEALRDLDRIDARQSRIVELRFFGGLSIEETAYVMGLSESTVRREWTFAKAWFQRELGASEE